jgi:hypothetical protein
LIPLLLVAVLVLLVIGIAAARSLPSRRAMRLILVLGIFAVILVTSPVTVAWAIWLGAVARCGSPPVVANTFAAGDTYDLPGQTSYGPGIFPIIIPDYYCTEADAKAHGFRRDSRP